MHYTISSTSFDVKTTEQEIRYAYGLKNSDVVIMEWTRAQRLFSFQADLNDYALKDLERVQRDGVTVTEYRNFSRSGVQAMIIKH